MCMTLHLLPQKRDEHLVQEYLRAARQLRTLLQGIRYRRDVH